MHDPLTVIKDFKLFGRTVAILWHRDPEIGGNDNSCDWFGSAKTKENGWYPADIDELMRLSPEARKAVDFIWFNFRSKLGRPWYRHPRWHVQHWHWTIPFIRDLKRWLFTRCAECGKRMAFGYAPVTNQWHSDGPEWFKGEVGKYHHECYARKQANRKDFESHLEDVIAGIE